MRRARRRFLTQTIYGQASLAGSVVIGGFVLLLLVGSQALEWYWLALLVAAAAAVAAWRTRQAIPSNYRLAQMIDERLNLHDTLSTAWHFGESRAGSETARAAQLERAIVAAETVDLKAALPRPRPRSLYAVSGLAMVACGLFAVRYGVTRTLDLRPSLVRIALQRWVPEETAYAAAEKKNPVRKSIEDQLQKLGINIGAEDRSLSEQGVNTTEAIDAPNARSQSADASKSHVAKADATDPFNQDDPGSDKTARGEAPGAENSNDQQQAEGQPNGGKQSNEQKAEKKGNQGQNSSNLMDKMRDAMASLMNKLKQQSRDGQSQQASSQQPKDGNQKGNMQKGAPMQGKPDGASQAQQGENNGQQQQGQGDKSQMAQGKSGQKSESPSDQKSGIGKEDGDKSAREAEQLAAMGKLSEIIGKRTKELSGEIMIETQSNGKQQLKTAYSGKQAAHAEAGREISRDEIPLEYQQYVQSYFEQVRKSDPNAAPPRPARGARGAGN